VAPPQGFEPVEFLDCAAVDALGLGLIAQEQRPAVGLLGDVRKPWAMAKLRF
jgi:hypothetical protein